MVTRTALVTGANRGIGRAIAAGLSDHGFEVIVGARKLEDAVPVAEEIGGEPLALDLTNNDHIQSFRARQAAEVDVLVNNAGVLFDRPLLTNPEDFDISMEVMVRAPWRLIRSCAPHMIKRGGGHIVNVSSNWGSFAQGLGGPGAYGIAKAALNALTLRMSKELPNEVKINAMCPGWVQTRMGGEGADLTPEEGADTAIWLATQGSDGPTGSFWRNRKRIEW